MFKSTRYLALLGLGFLLAGCSFEPQPANLSIAKASFYSPKEAVKETVLFIYDYDQERQKLEWKAIPVKYKVDNLVEDSINEFLKNNHLNEKFKNTKLDKVVEKAESTHFYFNGQNKNISTKDSIIFWSALDMTIIRNSDQTPHQLIID